MTPAQKRLRDLRERQSKERQRMADHPAGPRGALFLRR